MYVSTSASGPSRADMRTMSLQHLPFKVSSFKIVRLQFPNSCSVKILEVKEFSFPNREKTHVEIN